ncbi:hypothetical protein DFH09DRAFT_1126326 [Mycena vulgaris]|nr:hypothetical protein DFH09DRAFT_1126326 [Mycena vulgaris]
MIFAPRWQHVSFRVTYVALETLGRLAESDVPVLESIDLSPYQSSSLPQFDWGRFTMLHGARVSGFYILGNDFRAADLPLRWHLLTHLSILGPTRVQYVPGGLEPISSETALQTISRCPALRSCELRLVDEPEAAMHAQGLMVEHPFIDTFEVFCVGRGVGDTFRLLLDNLFLPQLRKLTLRIYFPRLHGQTQGSDTIPPLLRFLASSTHLGTLDLDTATFSKSSLLEILDNLPPSVQHLRLDDNPRLDGWGPPQTEYSGLDDDVLQAFATTPYCPALQTLHIQSSSTISDGGLLNFITTRMLVCPLRRVQIDFSREIQHDITPGLQPIIDGGLEVQITYPHVIPVHFSPWEGLPDGLLEH